VKAAVSSYLAGVMAAAVLACSPGVPDEARSATNSDSAAPTTDGDESRPTGLVNTVWRVTSPPDRAPGSFYLFLSNGTLVMTSCVETYRLATWQAEDGGRIAISEDQTVRYDAEFTAMSDRQARLQLNLKSERVALTLEQADAPYVCPDLRP
jgi:hypothetical protein